MHGAFAHAESMTRMSGLTPGFGQIAARLTKKEKASAGTPDGASGEGLRLHLACDSSCFKIDICIQLEGQTCDALTELGSGSAMGNQVSRTDVTPLIV